MKAKVVIAISSPQDCSECFILSNIMSIFLGSFQDHSCCCTKTTPEGIHIHHCLSLVACRQGPGSPRQGPGISKQGPGTLRQHLNKDQAHLDQESCLSDNQEWQSAVSNCVAGTCPTCHSMRCHGYDIKPMEWGMQAVRQNNSGVSWACNYQVQIINYPVHDLQPFTVLNGFCTLASFWSTMNTGFC